MVELAPLRVRCSGINEGCNWKKAYPFTLQGLGTMRTSPTSWVPKEKQRSYLGNGRETHFGRRASFCWRTAFAACTYYARRNQWRLADALLQSQLRAHAFRDKLLGHKVGSFLNCDVHEVYNATPLENRYIMLRSPYQLPPLSFPHSRVTFEAEERNGYYSDPVTLRTSHDTVEGGTFGPKQF